MRRKIKIIIKKSKLLSGIAALMVFCFVPGKWKKEFANCASAYEFGEIRGTEERRMAFDVLFCRFFYWISTDEYFRYKFMNLSDRGRKEYVGDKELMYELKKQNDPASYAVLRTKDVTAETFKEYFGRECVSIEGKKDINKFRDFCSRHDTFIVKPLSGSYGGKGIRKITISEDNPCDTVFGNLLDEMKKTPYMLEEVIEQDPGMAKFHPQSVNTIRLVTLNENRNVEVVQACVRIGTGDSIVDNGCLSSSVDIERGVVTSPGRCAHKAGLYTFHPDTGEQIIGAQIPKWEELKTQIVDMANVLPSQRVIGWDLALSTKGWVMVEGNSIPAIQTLSGEGVGARELFNRLLARR